MVYVNKFGVLRIMDELNGMFDIKSDDTRELADNRESMF